MEEKQEGNKVQAKKPVYKKWWFWLIIVLVVVAVIGGIGGAGASNNGNDDKGSNGNSDNNQTVNQQAYIGDTVTSGSLNFKVNKVENTKHFGSAYLGYDTEYNFILIYVEVENNSDSEINLTTSNFELKKGDSKYESHSGAIVLDNGFWVSESVGSNMKKNIVLVYEVPDSTTESEYVLSIKGSTFATKQSIILKQK